MIKDYSIGDQVSCVCNQCPVLSRGCFCLFFSISLHLSSVQMVSRSKCSAYCLHHTETDRHTCTHTYTLSQLIFCPNRHHKQCCPKLFLVISNEVTGPGRDTDLLYLCAMPERRNSTRIDVEFSRESLSPAPCSCLSPLTKTRVKVTCSLSV